MAGQVPDVSPQQPQIWKSFLPQRVTTARFPATSYVGKVTTPAGPDAGQG
jgi:hypothetical protein